MSEHADANARHDDLPESKSTKPLLLSSVAASIPFSKRRRCQSLVQMQKESVDQRRLRRPWPHLRCLTIPKNVVHTTSWKARLIWLHSPIATILPPRPYVMKHDGSS